MNDVAKQTILNMKFARIISEIAQIMQVDEIRAMDILYNSDTMQLINDGVSDLHCRSDRYLAEEIVREYQENNNRTL